jgi:N,N-dimethylformamidase
VKVVGYAAELRVRPGESIGFHVSSTEEGYTSRIVRLLHGDDNPAGPGFKAPAVTEPTSHPGAVQEIRPGSSVRVTNPAGLELPAGFALETWVLPTLHVPEAQLIALGDGPVLLLRDGVPALRVGGAELAADTALRTGVWYRLVAEVVAEGRASLTVTPHDALSGGEEVRTSAALAPWTGVARGDLVLGAGFNGKLEAPRVLAGGEVVAAWDLSRDIGSSRVTDTVGTWHGETVQRPMRAATGHGWDGTEVDWRRAPEQYGAIHFHDDDLDDAGWEESFTWTVPEDMPSGVYAAHLQAGGDEEFVPFVVRPRAGAPTARIALLLPTFSYLAYANEHLLAGEAGRTLAAIDGWEIDYPKQPQDVYSLANRLLSMYDRHSDGSGVCYSSYRRPLMNMRPKYLCPPIHDGKGGPHQLNADLHLVDWLHETGREVDVITDEDLHEEGVELLASYRVVLTGTHCEYWSAEMLAGAQAYLAGGGRLMYLGGNGMYWVTARDPERGHTIEIRRLGPSTRAWEPAPGEGHLSTTGELGGLWRYRAHPPQAWLGVGYTGQGNGEGRPYARVSRDPEHDWVFAGVGEDELIGDLPSLVIGYGAAGFEIDRHDPVVGSPAGCVVLATASGFSDSYQACSEEVLVSDSRQGGTVNDRVRSDLVLLDHPGGGRVFSVGSIAWCGCLSANGYENTVARVTGNVLEEFLQ